MADKNTQTTVTGRFVGGGLFEPRAQEEGKAPRFSACIVLDDGQSDKVEHAVKTAIQEKWGNKKPAGLQVWGVREGDDPEYEASYQQNFINPKASKKPQTLVKRDGVYVEVNDDDDLLYPGAYVAASIEAYGYDGDKNKNIKPGVSLNIRAVLFRKHGEHLGDVIDAESEFSGFDSEEFDDEDDWAA